MSLRKIAIVFCLIGIGLSACGAGLVALGGWGPCGPASTVASVGGYLTIIHAVWAFALFPDLEPLAGRWVPDWVLVLVWPAIVWSVLAFFGLLLWRWLRRDEHQLP
jgi:hypothetical protein